MKVILKREDCIGCGACAAVCPGMFKIADDGKSELIGSDNKMEREIEKPGCVEDAANGCPVQCIHIEK